MIPYDWYVGNKVEKLEDAEIAGATSEKVLLARLKCLCSELYSEVNRKVWPDLYNRKKKDSIKRG